MKKYQFHDWMCPCSDPQVTHLFPKFFLSEERNVAVCGIKMGGCANGRYRQPYCQACIKGAPQAEDRIFLKLCKANRKLIASLLSQINRIGENAKRLGGIFSEEEDW